MRRGEGGTQRHPGIKKGQEVIRRNKQVTGDVAVSVLAESSLFSSSLQVIL